MTVQFEKMTALGNDFIMIDGREFSVEQILPRVKDICDRRFGIGADGVIFILPGSTQNSFTMRIINSDGSEPEMCGNGIRCFALWLDNRGEFTEELLKVDTNAGTKEIIRTGNGYQVNMGAPELEPDSIPVLSSHIRDIILSVENHDFNCTAVSMGNPHAVIYTDPISDELFFRAGPEIETSPLFPQKTNVEFISVLNQSEIEMRVWERGCGETLACGTGACAAVVSGVLNKKHGNDITVHLRGGDLRISWSGNSEEPVFMTGPAQSVFKGEFQ